MSSTDTAPINVLVLEDDRDSRMLVEICVKRALGNVAITAIASIAEARKLSDDPELSFDLAVLDGMLLDGTLDEAWPFIAKSCENAVKLIVSALSEQELIKIGKGIQDAKIMRKPFNPKNLLEHLETHFGGRR